ncbi:response regulator receiver domain-containing protein [Maribacter spongiicola]|uniref:Response regulator receiver domain-containing protein n=1 Tax=Maribacter spongiicola TaxID=1206753 RepID=A0A4R7JWN3_9FLAO|nr:response regulator [Maribacter spongiicola]TDT41917.1 response regulator receiver domain-containing protein [Maribacter spongiicola]
MNYQILLIEDDPIFTFLLEKGIKHAQLKGETINFSNGKPAIEYLEKEYSDTSNYIIFLDLNMPVMNGWEFMDQLETFAKTDNCMVFILTSSAYRNDIERLKKKSLVIDFVTKPITEYILSGIKETIEDRFEKNQTI